MRFWGWMHNYLRPEDCHAGFVAYWGRVQTGGPVLFEEWRTRLDGCVRVAPATTRGGMQSPSAPYQSGPRVQRCPGVPGISVPSVSGAPAVAGPSSRFLDLWHAHALANVHDRNNDDVFLACDLYGC